MSKIDNNIVNSIKIFGLDMIKTSKFSDAKSILSSANTFYTIYMKHLKYNINNPNWINRDRILFSNIFLPTMYATLHMFGLMSLDDLNEYKKFNSKTTGFANLDTLGIDISSSFNGEVIGHAVGISLGERYLENLVKKYDEKKDIINFRTYLICKYEELMLGDSLEALTFLVKEKLKKIIIIAIKDENVKDSSLKEIYDDKSNNLESFGFNLIKTDNIVDDIDDAIEEAKDSKKASIIIIDNKNLEEEKEIELVYNKPLDEDAINKLKNKYKFNDEVLNNSYSEIRKNISKRLDKELSKWDNLRNELLNNNIRSVIDFLENRKVKIDLNIDNLKINDNYNEELILGNSKIFNILAEKSLFILNGSNDNYINTLCKINKSELMSYKNPLGRNILFGNRTNAMGSITNGLASLGFKMFLSLPLIFSDNIRSAIKFSVQNNLDVNYIFTQDTFLDTYEDTGYTVTDEINSLRLIPNLINFRPADINEIIGVYDIVSKSNKPTSIIIGNTKVEKLTSTNPKYVVAGAYRVKREVGEVNGILIASGGEVSLAIKLANELIPYGIDLRVVSFVSEKLFELQSDRYKNALLPKELKIFVLEFNNKDLWYKYTLPEYILGTDFYSNNGTKEELLNKYNLDIDSLKARIIEIYKS